MTKLAHSLMLSLGLLAGGAVSAYAQSENIAALPPGDSAPAAVAPVGPAVGEVVRPTATSPQLGPDPGKGFYPNEKQTRVVEPSPPLIGSDPGKGFYPKEEQTRPVEPSPVYPGLSPHDPGTHSDQPMPRGKERGGNDMG